jgi:hypothetical protein
MFEGCPVVPSRYYSEILYYYCPVPSLHAVRASGCKFSESHKVSVPLGPDKVFVIKFELSEAFVELLKVSGIVESSLDEVLMLLVIFI